MEAEGAETTHTFYVVVCGTQMPVLQFWKAFDLDSKRVGLDAQGSAMKAEKESSVRSRKKLAETTKHFRRLGDAEKIAAVGGLLRAYQEEVDSLTRRAKFSENAFFMMYKELYAAPDPVSSLEVINDLKVSEVEEENKKLRRELRDYETEFASLKNQDITIRNLEEKLSASAHDMEEAVHEKVEQRTRELESHLEAKKMELAQQKMNFERQLESARAESREAFSRLDAMQSDLFEQKQRSGLAKNALEAEMEAISEESLLTRTLQLENAQLKKQLEDLLSASTDPFGTPHGASSSEGSGVQALRDRQAEQDAVIATMRQELMKVKEDLVQSRADAANEKHRMEEELQRARQAQDTLTQELSTRPTVEQHNNVVQQLRIFQQLEYNIVDESEGGADLEGPTIGEGGDGVAPSEVEKVLVSRVRRLEHSLHQRELELKQCTSDLRGAQQELEERDAKIQDQVALVRNLEESVASLEKARKPLNISSSGDVGSEILLDAVEDQLSDTSGRSSANGATGTGSLLATSDNKMLEIVRGQRDRFRERMKELQSEKNRIEELAQSYKSSVTRLENDNMQLYHKIRYLQSYRGGGSSSSGSSNSTANHRVFPGGLGASSALEDGAGFAGGDVEAKYRGIYEEKMNPFVQFNKMESQQRYTNLNVVDKILLSSARMFLGHRITRNIAFSYILLLHFLVFATLYTFMHGCGISNES